MIKIAQSDKPWNKGKDRMINKFGLKSFGQQFVRGIREVSEKNPTNQANSENKKE